MRQLNRYGPNGAGEYNKQNPAQPRPRIAESHIRTKTEWDIRHDIPNDSAGGGGSAQLLSSVYNALTPFAGTRKWNGYSSSQVITAPNPSVSAA